MFLVINLPTSLLDQIFPADLTKSDLIHYSQHAQTLLLALSHLPRYCVCCGKRLHYIVWQSPVKEHHRPGKIPEWLCVERLGWSVCLCFYLFLVFTVNSQCMSFHRCYTHGGKRERRFTGVGFEKVSQKYL